MQSDKFRIALIGRPNVGKSTLFNRLTGTRDALVYDTPGVTRDIKERQIDIYGKSATLIDLPGMFDSVFDNHSFLDDKINKRLQKIVSESSLIIFVLDGDIGPATNDFAIAKILKKSGKDVIVVVNKSEKKQSETAQFDAMRLGFQEVIPISAEHGMGISDLMAVIEKKIPSSPNEIQLEGEEDPIKLAIVGRPNVGKSTLVNMILKEDKQLVADLAGLTRENSEAEFKFEDRNIVIIDTPGIRRQSRIRDILEQISVTHSKNAYKKADIVIMIIDASTLISGEIEKQDLTIASDIVKAGKALVIAFNKYDKTPYKKNDQPKFLRHNFEKNFSQLKEVPFLFISALTGENVEKMLSLALKTYDKHSKKFKTSELNAWLNFINQSDLLQSGSARFKLKYVTQVGSLPPTFVIFVSNKKNIRASHERCIKASLTKHFNLREVAVNIIFRERK